MLRCLVLLLVLLGSLSGSLMGAEAPLITDADWEQSATVVAARAGTGAAPATAAPLVALLIGLAFIIALAVGGFFLVRFAARRRGGAHPARHLQLVESLPLGLKRSLHLVRLGDQVLVVGSHEQGLTAITSIPVTSLSGLPEAEARVDAALAAAPTSAKPFAQAFAHAVQSVLGREKP